VARLGRPAGALGLALALGTLAVATAASGGSQSVRTAACPFVGFSQGVIGFPGGLALGPDKQLWYADVIGELGAFNVQTHSATEYPLPSGTMIHGVAAGRPGEIWFTALNDAIGRFDIATHQTTLYSLPPNSQPHKIVQGPDGNIWFSEQKGGRLGEFDRATGTITGYSKGLPAGNGMHGLVRGTGNDLWVTLQFSDEVAHFNVATKKFDRFFKFSHNSQPHDLVVSGNTIYVTLQKASRLGVVNLKTRKVKEYKTGLPRPKTTNLAMLGPRLVEPAVTADKRYVWMTTLLADKLFRFDTKRAQVTGFACNQSKGSIEIVRGPDRHLWFTDTDSHRIDEIK
jgi:virginiamycin B lyase